MKPEVTKIFDDLDAWLDHCRFEMINFDPADLYKSKEYKEWDRRRKGGNGHYHNANGRKPWHNNDRGPRPGYVRKPYNK